MTMLSANALQNRLTVETFLAGTHAPDLDGLGVIDETVNEDIRCHGFPGFDATSRDEYKAWFRFFRASFTNMDFRTTALVADEDHVAARWVVAADHTGDFAGLPATGRRITFDGVALYRMRDGRISETWLHANETALMAGLLADAAA
jgi:predicted ester cyclase